MGQTDNIRPCDFQKTEIALVVNSLHVAHLELQVYIDGLLPLLHQAQTEGLEVDLVLGLFDDLPQQSPRGSEVIVLVSQQVLEHHGKELGPGEKQEQREGR